MEQRETLTNLEARPCEAQTQPLRPLGRKARCLVLSVWAQRRALNGIQASEGETMAGWCLGRQSLIKLLFQVLDKTANCIQMLPGKDLLLPRWWSIAGRGAQKPEAAWRILESGGMEQVSCSLPSFKVCSAPSGRCRQGEARQSRNGVCRVPGPVSGSRAWERVS